MSALRQALLLTAVFAAIPLIENGIRHTPEGAELTLIAGERELGLADTGPGIPPGEYGNATRPMHRLNKSRVTEGAGWACRS